MFIITSIIFAVVVAMVLGYAAYGLWVLGVEAWRFEAAAAEAREWASTHLYDSEADAAEREVQILVEDALTACLTCGEQADRQKGEQTLSCACRTTCPICGETLMWDRPGYPVTTLSCTCPWGQVSPEWPLVPLD